MTVSSPLAGKYIVVTRPAGQAAHLAEALFECGAHPILCPVLVIEALNDLRPLHDIAARLDGFDLAIFISPNAVEKSLAQILKHRTWPASLPTATIGVSSKLALAAHGIAETLVPINRFDSEALLELPALQNVMGKRVVIFRGEGGRELLAETLRQRGADVTEVASYRRGKPQADASELLRHWEDGKLDAITVTSSEGLRNLHDMVGKLRQAWLRKTPMFVPHVRIGTEASRLGLNCIHLTGPGDDGLIAGLIDYFAHHG